MIHVTIKGSPGSGLPISVRWDPYIVSVAYPGFFQWGGGGGGSKRFLCPFGSYWARFCGGHQGLWVVGSTCPQSPPPPYLHPCIVYGLQIIMQRGNILKHFVIYHLLKIIVHVTSIIKFAIDPWIHFFVPDNTNRELHDFVAKKKQSQIEKTKRGSGSLALGFLFFFYTLIKRHIWLYLQIYDLLHNLLHFKSTNIIALCKNVKRSPDFMYILKYNKQQLITYHWAVQVASTPRCPFTLNDNNQKPSYHKK